MAFRLDGARIEFKDKPRTRNPKFVQGLLGVGQVGLLAAKQMITSLRAQKIADVYSPDFLYPGSTIPGVVYSSDGTVELGKDELFYDSKNELFILTGLYQGTSPRGYYDLANALLDMCREFGVKEIFTLGGFGVGQAVEEPKVKAVVADGKTVKELQDRGISIEIATASEGSLGVTGLAGLLIPLAVKNGMRAACLLGETHGSYPDPRAAKASLMKLGEILGVAVPTPELDEQIKMMESEMAKLEEQAKKMKEAFEQWQKGGEQKGAGQGDLPYIG